jgi:hypothetical protein
VRRSWKALAKNHRVLVRRSSGRDKRIAEGRLLTGEVRVLKEALAAATGKTRIDLSVEQRRRLALKGKALTAEERRACCQIVRPQTILAWFRQLAASQTVVDSCIDAAGRSTGRARPVIHGHGDSGACERRARPWTKYENGDGSGEQGG